MDASSTRGRNPKEILDVENEREVAEYLLADRYAGLAHDARMACQQAAESAEAGRLDVNDLSELRNIAWELEQLLELTEVIVEESAFGDLELEELEL